MLSRPYFVDGMNGISRLSEIWICETRHIPLSWDPDFQRKLDDVFFNCHCDIWSYNCLRPWLSGPFVGTLGPTCLSCEPNGGRARGRPDSPEVYSLAYLSVDCYMDKNYDSLTCFASLLLRDVPFFNRLMVLSHHFPGKHQSQRQEKNSELLAISEERAAQDPSSWVSQVNMWCKHLWTTCFPWFAV